MVYNYEKNKVETVARVRGLTVVYDRTPVLWDINVDFPKGKLIAVMGPNGAGKSTLIKAMLKLVPRISGSVNFFLGEADTSLKANRRSIAYVPQSESVDWDFPINALEVVTMGCYGNLGIMRRPTKKDRVKAFEMLERVGMEAFASRRISELSGGQQQRIFIARALMQEAEVYFLDEPFKGVDATTERTIMNLLRSLSNNGKTIITVHHDLQTAAIYFDHIILLNRCVKAQGNIKSVFTNDNLRSTYGDMKITYGGRDYND